MKKVMTIFGAVLFATLIMTSCGGKTTEQCKDDIRAYEFGREMKTWTELRGGGSLSKAIDEYSSGLGINPPYDANNDCVKRGYSDAQDNIESPYNKEGKSWTSF
jgi:hypothetical protein